MQEKTISCRWKR